MQSGIRTQKQLKLNKLTGEQKLAFLSNNGIDLNWNVAIEIEVLNSGDLFPLHAMQLKLFPAIKDRYHEDGMACIPD